MFVGKFCGDPEVTTKNPGDGRESLLKHRVLRIAAAEDVGDEVEDFVFAQHVQEHGRQPFFKVTMAMASTAR